MILLLSTQRCPSDKFFFKDRYRIQGKKRLSGREPAKTTLLEVRCLGPSNKCCLHFNKQVIFLLRVIKYFIQNWILFLFLSFNPVSKIRLNLPEATKHLYLLKEIEGSQMLKMGRYKSQLVFCLVQCLPSALSSRNLWFLTRAFLQSYRYTFILPIPGRSSGSALKKSG